MRFVPEAQGSKARCEKTSKPLLTHTVNMYIFNPVVTHSHTQERNMLVLGRKRNERVLINGDIEVTVLRIDSNRVTLGISAPRDVTIRRSEPADGPAIRSEAVELTSTAS